MTQLHQSMLDEIQRRNYTESTTRAYERIIKDFAFYSTVRPISSDQNMSANTPLTSSATRN